MRSPHHGDKDSGAKRRSAAPAQMARAAGAPVLGFVAMSTVAWVPPGNPMNVVFSRWFQTGLMLTYGSGASSWHAGRSGRSELAWPNS